MKIEKRDIYEQIGNLFYAIAADQHVKPLEVAELKLLISRDWLPRLEEFIDGYDSDATEILLTMDNLQANATAADKAYYKFARFYTKHSNVFTAELKDKILQTTLDITQIFSHNGKKDSIHVTLLKNLLDSSHQN